MLTRWWERIQQEGRWQGIANTRGRCLLRGHHLSRGRYLQWCTRCPYIAPTPEVRYWTTPPNRRPHP